MKCGLHQEEFWGAWIKIAQLMSDYKHDYDISFETISEAPSSFDVEIKYKIGNQEKIDSVVGPGSWSFGFGMCICIAEIRLRSHTLGQIVRVTVKGL